MFKSLHALKQNHQRGMTLVELMIVVAILGILASVAGVAFFRYVKKAKISKLESLVNKAALGQGDALRGQYYPPANGATATDFFDGELDKSNTNKKKRFSTFLNISATDVEPGQILTVITGTANTTCGHECCSTAGFTQSQPTRWYVVCASQDLDNNPGTPPTRVVKLSTQKNTITVNEGN